VGGIKDIFFWSLAEGAENAVVCKVEDVEGIKRGVLKILQDTDLANKIREGGFRTAGKYDILESREKFLEAVRG
jgi:radical SAM superfamily enzyme